MTEDIEAIRPVPIHFIKTFCVYRPPLAISFNLGCRSHIFRAKLQRS